MLQYLKKKKIHLVLWNRIDSNSATKGQKDVWKASLPFYAPSRNNSISRHLNLTKSSYPPSPHHKTTSCIPLGYYSNPVSLISLCVVLLPLQPRIILYMRRCFCIPAILSTARMCVCVCVWNACLLFSAHMLCTRIQAARTAGSDFFFFFFFFIFQSFFPSQRSLNQVVAGSPPTRCLFSRPSACLWIIQSVKRPSLSEAGSHTAPCNLGKWYSRCADWLDM